MATARPAFIVITTMLLFSGSTLSSAQQPEEKQDDQTGYSEMMPGAMMGGRQYRMMRQGIMPFHMMKIMFAVADVDGDGTLSFEEVSAIHKRIFDKVDTNKDAKVSPEEIQAFLRDQ
ncbi:EF-hand domain-containing protein [Ensifer adhaerens]|uniref:EF-hand domain-containing protein n=1 Tax=Ensifer adhaerens TaxID=106592 RepID=UPI000DC46D31|nr:EF-hand domain-containing protein [Ensifer adhaerens]RAS08336.1 actin cytoskeleton-regulatory complex protein END3 [Ensifer adhaerens]